MRRKCITWPASSPGLRRPDAAAAAFERALKLDPADPGVKVNLGQIALQQRQYDRALTFFRDAVTAEPYNVTATYSIALALMRSGKPEEGRKAMQQFEQLRDSAYGVTYSQTYLAQGKYAEAIASTGAEPELVNPATPAVTFSDATTTMLSGPQAGGAVPGGVTLVDVDGDGDLDILEVGGISCPSPEQQGRCLHRRHRARRLAPNRRGGQTAADG